MQITFPSIVVLTGAGISVESGIRAYRADGTWDGQAVASISSANALEHDRYRVLSFYDELRSNIWKYSPNAAHFALAQFQATYAGIIDVVTQNVDGLHGIAGSKNVLAMHGSLDHTNCQACGHAYLSIIILEDDPDCPSCGASGCLRPDVVLYGETPRYIREIEHKISGCDIFAVVGTSGSTLPAANFVDLANAAGAKTVWLNIGPPPDAGVFDDVRIGKATTLVSDFVAAWNVN